MEEKKICRLCLSKLADNIKSHIISDFLTRRIFDLNPVKAIQLLKGSAKEISVQSTPWEKYFLCAGCEQKFSNLERLVAPFIKEILNNKSDSSVLKKMYFKKLEFMYCQKLPPQYFILFIYSLIWRASATTIHHFGAFSLPDNEEEFLRLELNKYLKESYIDLKACLDGNMIYSPFDISLIMPIENRATPGGILSGCSYSTDFHLLMLVEFACMFSFKPFALNFSLRMISNKKVDKVKIGIGKYEDWFKFNEHLVKKMVK